MKHLRKQGAEEDQDWKSRDDEPRMSRLRQRRGRSIVHRSLEDNYGAVVVANHEALAQFLEQVRVNLSYFLRIDAHELSNIKVRGVFINCLFLFIQPFNI